MCLCRSEVSPPSAEQPSAAPGNRPAQRSPPILTITESTGGTRCASPWVFALVAGTRAVGGPPTLDDLKAALTQSDREFAKAKATKDLDG